MGAQALDVLGERWAMLVLAELLAGPARYGELQARLPGIGTAQLAARLRELTDAGLIAQAGVHTGQYALTSAGPKAANSAPRVPSPPAEPIGTTSGVSRCSISSSTRSGSAPALSILFTKRSVGTPNRCSARIRTRV